MGIKADSVLFRYIVPFELKSEDSFETLNSKLLSNAKWVAAKNEGEEDLYSYVYDFLKPDGNCIGTGWEYYIFCRIT